MQNHAEPTNPIFQYACAFPIRASLHVSAALEVKRQIAKQTLRKLYGKQRRAGNFWNVSPNSLLVAPIKANSPFLKKIICIHSYRWDTESRDDSQILHYGNLIHSLKFKFAPVLFNLFNLLFA